MTAIFLEYDTYALLAQSRIKALKQMAQESELLRARYCLHRSHNDGVQEMVIALLKGSQVPVHRHAGKSESYHMIEGLIEVLFYDNQGNRTDVIKLGPQDSGLPFIYRLAPGVWHTVRVLSECAVIHETTTGPFRENDREILELKNE